VHLPGDDVGDLLLGVGGAEAVNCVEVRLAGLGDVVGVALVARDQRRAVLLEDEGAAAHERLLGRAALLVVAGQDHAVVLEREGLNQVGVDQIELEDDRGLLGRFDPVEEGEVGLVCGLGRESQRVVGPAHVLGGEVAAVVELGRLELDGHSQLVRRNLGQSLRQARQDLVADAGVLGLAVGEVIHGVVREAGHLDDARIARLDQLKTASRVCVGLPDKLAADCWRTGVGSPSGGGPTVTAAGCEERRRYGTASGEGEAASSRDPIAENPVPVAEAQGVLRLRLLAWAICIRGVLSSHWNIGLPAFQMAKSASGQTTDW
jgi:hypothetical protein